MVEAIIESGSKQYRVKQGDIIDVDLLGKAPQDAISFEHVLLVNDGTNVVVGAPYVKGFVVQGTIQGEVKGEKTVSFFYRRRTASSKRKVGHRQKYSRVKITSISQQKA